MVLPDGIAQVNATTATALRAHPGTRAGRATGVVPSLVVESPNRYPSPLPDEPLKIVSQPQDPTVLVMATRAGDQSPQSACCPAGICRSPSAMNMGSSRSTGRRPFTSTAGKIRWHCNPPILDTRIDATSIHRSVRYGVPNAETAKSLGLSSPQRPRPEVVRLGRRSVLSKDAVPSKHDTLLHGPSPQFRLEPRNTWDQSGPAHDLHVRPRQKSAPRRPMTWASTSHRRASKILPT